MIKWSTFTLNHSPRIHCAAAPPLLGAAPPHPPTLCHPICPVSPACHSQDHAGRWRVVAVPRCPPLRLHSPSAPHLKVPSPSLLEMAPVNTFGFFSLAILLRVLGQFPQAENNYPLSITGALWDLYLRKKSQFCWLPTPMSLPHYLSRQECKHFSGSDPPPHVGLSDRSPRS